MEKILKIGQEVNYILDGQTRVGTIEKIALNEKNAVIITRQNDRIVIQVEDIYPIKLKKCKDTK